jgi:hypothetical protein
MEVEMKYLPTASNDKPLLSFLAVCGLAALLLIAIAAGGAGFSSGSAAPKRHAQNEPWKNGAAGREQELGASLLLFFAGVFPPVDVACGSFDKEMHENTSDLEEHVVVQVTDNCQAFDSLIAHLDKDGKRRVDDIRVPDGETVNKSFTLKAKDKLTLDCKGNSERGKCSYVLSVTPLPKK